MLMSSNVWQVVANSNTDTGPWEIDSLPKKNRLAAEQAERQRQAARETATASEAARQEFSSGTGDPISGVWSSSRTSLTIRKEGALYVVHVEGDSMLRGEYAGPYKDSQIQLGGMAGNISVIPSTAQLIFGGERFSKIRE